ncbi:hypothetical protein LTR62_002979 [Meristemomyces frigidus]|uniref:MOSC domain-containing protein n=1 Tax=Meristemomyces frigidus TaxID=1508187 RepID=A0AAN7TQ52_9PEZI|nr:hypothetical protein LTR62_002979 [Meristemomyces frigidus]
MAALALLQHYLDYLTSPAVIISFLIVIVPIIYTVAQERLLIAGSLTKQKLTGLRRLGLSGRSHLDGQHDLSVSEGDNQPYIKALFTYPIKSCRGIELAASEVGTTGLKYDRMFAFAQLVPSKSASEGSSDELAEQDVPQKQQWRFVTQRDFPRLASVQTELWVTGSARKNTSSPVNRSTERGPSHGQARTRSRARGETLKGQLEQGANKQKGATPTHNEVVRNGCLVLRFHVSRLYGMWNQQLSVVVPISPSVDYAKAKGYKSEKLSIWKDCPLATNVTPEFEPAALTALRMFLGATKPLALFRIDASTRRPVTRSLPTNQPEAKYHIGFADAFPVNILSLASVKAIDKQLPSEAATKHHLDARRFRANIYLTGTSAFAEDKWKLLSLGRRIGRDKKGLFECEADYHVACRTARCTMPNVDPETGIKDTNEPYSTLAKTRKVDRGADPFPCLGMQMIPLFERGFLRVGDEVVVRETGEHVYEKMFA